MNVFLVRHGESEANRLEVHGTEDTELSELGARQAEMVAERLSEAEAEIIICSRYVRAMQTAKIIGKAIKKKIIYTPLLNEWRIPSELHKVEYGSDKDLKIHGKIEKFAHNPNWHYSDEENAFELIRRAEDAIRFLSSRKEKKLVVVTHGAFIKAMLQTAILGPNYDASEFHRINELFPTANTGITELEIDDGKIKGILKFNDSAHLR